MLFCSFAFSRNLFMTYSVLKGERKYQRVVLSCFFVLFWMLLFFIYNVLKRKANRLLQISSFNKLLILKKHLALHIGNWVRVCCYIRHICLHLLFCFANLRQSYQGDIPCLTRKKSWQRLYIFLKPRSMKVRYFKLTC